MMSSDKPILSGGVVSAPPNLWTSLRAARPTPSGCERNAAPTGPALSVRRAGTSQMLPHACAPSRAPCQSGLVFPQTETRLERAGAQGGSNSLPEAQRSDAQTEERREQSWTGSHAAEGEAPETGQHLQGPSGSKERKNFRKVQSVGGKANVPNTRSRHGR